jgi:endonuclease/exonuclease/phosphatase family metal-dependent hydrolase
MSRFPLNDAASHTFRPSPPTTTKGFVRGTVYWQNGDDEAPPRPVTLISVHLDFSRRKVREAQIAEMVEALTGVSTPVIILGDFNADWTADDSPVREVADEFGLRAFTPTEEKLGTYGKAKRLDWILISEELRFVEYAVVPGLVSDHLALLAKIGWAVDH